MRIVVAAFRTVLEKIRRRTRKLFEIVSNPWLLYVVCNKICSIQHALDILLLYKSIIVSIRINTEAVHMKHQKYVLKILHLPFCNYTARFSRTHSTGLVFYVI